GLIQARIHAIAHLLTHTITTRLALKAVIPYPAYLRAFQAGHSSKVLLESKFGWAIALKAQHRRSRSSEEM
ncbi:MAG: hypothetical protein ACYT04_000000102165, partial [Nostoc sp.]